MRPNGSLTEMIDTESRCVTISVLWCSRNTSNGCDGINAFCKRAVVKPSNSVIADLCVHDLVDATIRAMSARRTGKSSVSNQGLRLSHALLRQEGWGMGTRRGWSLD